MQEGFCFYLLTYKQKLNVVSLKMTRVLQCIFIKDYSWSFSESLVSLGFYLAGLGAKRTSSHPVDPIACFHCPKVKTALEAA